MRPAPLRNRQWGAPSELPEMARNPRAAARERDSPGPEPGGGSGAARRTAPMAGADRPRTPGAGPGPGRRGSRPTVRRRTPRRWRSGPRPRQGARWVRSRGPGSPGSTRAAAHSRWPGGPGRRETGSRTPGCRGAITPRSRRAGCSSGPPARRAAPPRAAWSAGRGARGRRPLQVQALAERIGAQGHRPAGGVPGEQALHQLAGRGVPAGGHDHPEVPPFQVLGEDGEGNEVAVKGQDPVAASPASRSAFISSRAADRAPADSSSLGSGRPRRGSDQPTRRGRSATPAADTRQYRGIVTIVSRSAPTPTSVEKRTS